MSDDDTNDESCSSTELQETADLAATQEDYYRVQEKKYTVAVAENIKKGKESFVSPSPSSSSSSLQQQAASIFSLPRELMCQILSYLDYDCIAKSRRVCQYFNLLCKKSLNDGFNYAEKLHCQVHKEIRAKLPRRESERRSHPFSRHADILSAIETRMSLLQITYSKYMDSGYSCFIPGKVIDELLRVIRYVRSASDPPRSHEVLMELRDISSMAMEHFEEKILPDLKQELVRDGLTLLPGGITVEMESPRETLFTRLTPSRYREISNSMKRPASASLDSVSPKRPRLSHDCIHKAPSTKQLSINEPSTDNQMTGMELLEQRLAASELINTKQEKQLSEQANCIEELQRKLTEFNHRFTDLADVLRVHFETSKLIGAEKITAIIQENKSSACLSISPSLTNITEPVASTSTEELRNVRSTRSRLTNMAVTRKGRRQLNTSTSLQRAKTFKERLDDFRDECSF